MRFAWERENSADYVPVEQSFISRLVYIAYNVIWWAPIILPFIGVIDYRTGFIVLFVVTLVRAISRLRESVMSSAASISVR